MITAHFLLPSTPFPQIAPGTHCPVPRRRGPECFRSWYFALILQSFSAMNQPTLCFLCALEQARLVCVNSHVTCIVGCVSMDIYYF